MNKLFCSLFLKNSIDNSNSSSSQNISVRKKYGNIAGFSGILINLLLFAIKVFAGILSGSISIIVDSINNLADMSSSVITLAGFKMASKPSDKEHPFGHERIEYVAGIIISILIIVMGIESTKSSITRIIYKETVTFSYITLLILFLSIIIKLWQASLYRYIGKEIDSLAIYATGVESKNDVYMTIAIIGSLLIYKFTNINLDAYMGTIISLYIIYSGFLLLKETMSPLLGERPKDALLSNIKKEIEKNDNVLGIHDLIVHSYGPGKTFASVHAEVDKDENISTSHDLADNIMEQIKSNLGVNITVHIDPIDTKDPTLKKLLLNANEVIRDISDISSIHDMRIVRGDTYNNLIFDVIRKPGSKLSEYQIKELFSTLLKELPANQTNNLVINIDEEYTEL